MGMYSKHLEKENFLFEEEEKKRGKLLEVDNREIRALGNFFHVTPNNRLRHPSYLSNAGSKQAVFKIINGGFGKFRLDRLIQYVARDLEYQKDDESLQMKDQDGNVVDYNKEIKAWTDDFISSEMTEKQKWKEKKKYDLEYRRDMLNYFSEKRELSRDEQIELSSLKQQIVGNYCIIKDKATGELKKVSLDLKKENDFHHMLFSVGGTGNSQPVMNHVMQTIIDRHFGSKGQKAMFVFHGDSENEHFHVIVNARSETNRNKKVRYDLDDINAIRMDFAQELTRYGIQRGAIQRKDNPLLFSRILEQTESLKKNYTVYQAKKEKGFVDSVKYKSKAISTAEYLSKALSGEIKIERDIKAIQKQLKSKENEISIVEKSLNDTKIKEVERKSLKTKRKELELERDNLKQAIDGQQVQSIKDKQKELNLIKAELLKATSSEEIKATVNILSVKYQSFDRKMGEMLEEEKQEHNKTNVRRRRKIINKQFEGHRNDVKEAIKYFKKIKNKDNAKEVKIATNTLKSLLKGKSISLMK